MLLLLFTMLARTSAAHRVVVLLAAQSDPEEVLGFFSFIHDLNGIATLMAEDESAIIHRQRR